ncbi:hypothetical protein CDIK_2424 [Cucumispora dikerogammari]|nr:hypothetical protein CDIK_2424 [Cucumispora dikerogammari]
MCKYQSRYNFKSYMPANSIKVGIMFYKLTDFATIFVLKFKLYTGFYNSIKETVKNINCHVKLFNYNLYMDNYYNSFKLCKNLPEDKIFCRGNMRIRRSKSSKYST